MRELYILSKSSWINISTCYTCEGRWPRGRADVSEPGGPGFDVSAAAGRRSSALSTLNYCVVLPQGAVLYLASNHGIACARRLGPTQPVTDF